MEKVRNKLIAAACFLVVCFIIGNAVTYVVSQKTIWDVFFEKNNNTAAKRAQAEKLMDYNGQTYEIDDYTIKLEQTLFDAKTDIGYCIFSVKKKNGEPEAEIDKWGNTPTDSFGNRFQFDIFETGTRTYKFERQKDILYVYVTFALDTGYDGTIDLIDYQQKDSKTIDGYRRYVYHLKETSTYKEYKIDDARKLTVSPIGLTLDGTKMESVNLKFYYKDGSVRTIIDSKKDIEPGSPHECSVNGRVRRQYTFKELIDIDAIDYVLLNNRKLSLQQQLN